MKKKKQPEKPTYREELEKKILEKLNAATTDTLFPADIAGEVDCAVVKVIAVAVKNGWEHHKSYITLKPVSREQEYHRASLTRVKTTMSEEEKKEEEVKMPALRSLPEIKFHEAGDGEPYTVHKGIGCMIDSGAMVEVWEIKDNTGFHVVTRRPTDDGKQIVLRFGLTRQAAQALAGLLTDKLYPEDGLELK